MIKVVFVLVVLLLSAIFAYLALSNKKGAKSSNETEPSEEEDPGTCETTGDWAMSGSGTVFIKGYFDANYNPNMTLEQAQTFMKSTISLACYRDSSSGGVIRMMSITKDGCERTFTPYQDFPIR